MIASTYMLSGVLLAITAWLFDAGDLTSFTQTIAWVVVFFFASAGASAAYLTVSEIFPMETRALAIAFFYAVGTGLGGIIGPVLFGSLISTKRPSEVAIGYVIGGALMFASGLVEILLGVDAERKSLEEVASPLSAVDGATADRREASTPARIPRATWAPRPQLASYPMSDPYRFAEVDQVVSAVDEADGTVTYAEIARRTGARFWGPGRLRGAVRGAVYSGRIMALGGDRYGRRVGSMTQQDR
jgi:MFS family permease